MKYHGDKPKLLEYDETEGIVDVFVYRDNRCPYPYTITNTKNDSDIWTHQGFYLKEFIPILDVFFKKFIIIRRVYQQVIGINFAKVYPEMMK